MKVLQLIGNVAVAVSALLSWGFVVAYHLTSPWWRSSYGRQMMSMAVVIGTVLGLSIVRIVTGSGDSFWFAAVRTAVFTVGVPWVLAWRLWLLVKAQRRDRDNSPTD